MSDAKPGDVVILDGRVRYRATAKPVIWSKVVIRDGATHAAQQVGDWELELASGHRIAVRPMSVRLDEILLPIRSERGEWAELDIPLSERYAAFAPAPDESTTLSHAELAPDVEVRVWARVAEVEAGEGGGPRVAPERMIAAIDIDRAATGSDREELLDAAIAAHERAYAPKSPAAAAAPVDRSWLVGLAVRALAAVPLLLAWIAIARHEAKPDNRGQQLAGAILLLAAGPVFAARMRKVFIGHADDDVSVDVMLLTVTGMGWAIAALGFFQVFRTGAGRIGVLLPAPAYAIVVAVWIVPALVRRAKVQRVRRLLEPSDGWSVHRGKVTAPLEPHGHELAVGGRRIASKHVLFATDTSAMSKRYRFLVVPQHARAMVAGRIKDDREIVAAHVDSVVVAASHEGDPGDMLRHSARREVQLVVELVAIGAAILATSLIRG